MPGATTVTFDSLSADTPSPYTEGLITYSWPAGQSPFVQGSTPSQWAAPVNDTTTFLTVGSPSKPSTVTISFSTPISYFGMYMGSPDTYNGIFFYDKAGLIGSYTGDQLINPGNGNQQISDYLDFYSAGGTISQIVMTSTSAAFETDNHAYDTSPEPGTLAGPGLGLALAALLARRRRLFSQSRSA